MKKRYKKNGVPYRYVWSIKEKRKTRPQNHTSRIRLKVEPLGRLWLFGLERPCLLNKKTKLLFLFPLPPLPPKGCRNPNVYLSRKNALCYRLPGWLIINLFYYIIVVLKLINNKTLKLKLYIFINQTMNVTRYSFIFII